MTNLAFDFTCDQEINTDSNTVFQVHKDTLIFDGNSKTAHLIARTLLVNDPQQKFALMPKQNSPFFGVELPEKYSQEKFLLISLSGEIKCGKEALDFMSERLNLKDIYH
jgi:hypothetical protein